MEAITPSMLIARRSFLILSKMKRIKNNLNIPRKAINLTYANSKTPESLNKFSTITKNRTSS